MQKTEVARRELGTALALFIENCDPVSVHMLACAGCEIAEHLTRKAGKLPFAVLIAKTYPEFDSKRIKTLQNQYWNSFKHATNRGKERNDQVLLESFTDAENDQVLFVGWRDYSHATGALPIETQVFTVWYFALYSHKLEPDDLLRSFQTIFPDLNTKSRADQKRALRKVIAIYREDNELMNNPATERVPLILTG